MNLGELGEFGLIRRIAQHFQTSSQGMLGIGDDCAVLPQEGDRVTLVTTDLLIENIHFLRHTISPEDLGHKALAVNLSDIAAMGGRPSGAFLSIGLPKSTEISWLDSFFEGIKKLGDATECPLLGGDTTKSGEIIIINFAVLGEALKYKIKYRSSARAGDIIAVTGTLGDSPTGLKLLLKKHSLDNPNRRKLVKAHYRPMAHLQEGQWLAAYEEVHAMLDVSDGIDSDLGHIMKRSCVGASVDLDTLPISPSMNIVCSELGWPTHELALTGGEDYCLLCTVDPKAYHRLASAFKKEFGRPLTAIGTIDQGDSLKYKRKGGLVELKRHGFNHFK